VNEIIARMLKDQDFHLVLKTRNSDCDLWSREIQYGNVKTVLCIYDTNAGFEYRVRFASFEERGSDKPGFDGADLWNAVGCMHETWCAWKAARRCLEKGIVRRSMRKFLKKA
jgi:hypothetical protein